MWRTCDQRIDALREAIRQDIGWDDRDDALLRTRDGFRLRLDVRGVEVNRLPMEGRPDADRTPAKIASEIAQTMFHVMAMREGDQEGPPAALFPPPLIINRMMQHEGIDHQDLVDRAWRAMIERTGGTDTQVAWRTRGPSLLGQRPEPSLDQISQRVRFDLSGIYGYLSGIVTPTYVSVHSLVTADGRIAVRVSSNSVTMTVTDKFPETVVVGLKGRRLDEVVSVPTLDGEHIVISAVRPAKEFTTFHLDGWAVIEPVDRRPKPPCPNIVAALEGPAAVLIAPPLRA